MQSEEISNEEKPILSDKELHAQAHQYISEFNQLIFQNLPSVMSQIIEREVWKKRNNPYKNFGEYALDKSPEGLGITNNEMLWLLRSAMDINTQHVAQWGDVLSMVDNSVRVYAKENKISIKDLNNDLREQDNTNPNLYQENNITYLPSRSRSIDGQLLKLKKKDPLAYENVIQGKININDAWVKVPRKQQQPIETIKNKFFNLSKSERETFLEWLEQEKENLLS
ncbi:MULTISPECIES: hypothetical protein [Legionella]|uniref:Uncharacterized protein n=1 Tax=Legionella resiliens TaxID=2905958 RepID=A0ABS8WZ47_9GAMM|nr:MULTISPECIES: hypothetical protein [unclassified Legionella]MCE0722592.1 hypothetical protein [Legionella sp. 9fVS26]MCE3531745.1 hypothetical protein [Legionella sp. 8cVS16]QLZ67770.1 hypothetical protein FOLKNPGA_00543 [Legionella sp. PC1000]